MGWTQEPRSRAPVPNSPAREGAVVVTASTEVQGEHGENQCSCGQTRAGVGTWRWQDHTLPGRCTLTMDGRGRAASSRFSLHVTTPVSSACAMTAPPFLSATLSRTTPKVNAAPWHAPGRKNQSPVGPAFGLLFIHDYRECPSLWREQSLSH